MDFNKSWGIWVTSCGNEEQSVTFGVDFHHFNLRGLFSLLVSYELCILKQWGADQAEVFHILI